MTFNKDRFFGLDPFSPPSTLKFVFYILKDYCFIHTEGDTLNFGHRPLTTNCRKEDLSVIPEVIMTKVEVLFFLVLCPFFILVFVLGIFRCGICQKFYFYLFRILHMPILNVTTICFTSC